MRWTLFNSDGFEAKRNVVVSHNNDGTTSIGATLHLTRDLVVTETRIDSRVASWYLEKAD